MSATPPSTLSIQIAQRYFQTTAERGYAPSKAHYEQSSFGLGLRLQPWLPKDRGATCLDLACGCGEVLYLLERQQYQQTTGVDLCAEELERARSYVKSKLVKADVLDYLKQCPSQSVDFVTALNFLEHLSKDVLLATMTEIRRVLRPGGTLVAMVPNAISPFGGLTRHWDITHEWAFTPNNFQQLAALVGFDSKVEFRECGPVVHGVISAVRYLLWQLVRASIATRFLIEVADTKGGVYTMDMLVRLRAPLTESNALL
jgi:SAM-dependent methyltransferase